MFWSFVVLGIAVLILGYTGIGRVIGSASEHFLLYYAGVFVLLALTATVMIGLVATDRIIMSPERRVTAQAVHRAVATGAMAFLVIHIVSEIAAGRSGPADAVIPFLDHGRTFYLGLGTVASDLMVMIAVTGIFRARLASNMSPLMWRLLHGTAYAAWVMGIYHGLMAGRPAKTFFGFPGFVAWSYGFCVAGVAIALVVRLVAKDRAAEHTIAQPVPDRPVPPWSPTVGAPVLGQAAFGATPLAVAPARPHQRALPAPPAAASARQPASLPAGRGQVGDSGEFGHDETHAEYAYDGTRVHFGDDTGGYGQGGARVGVGQGDTRVRFGGDTHDTRGGYGRDDGRVHFGDDPRGSYGRDDPRGSYGRDNTRGSYGGDDPRGSNGRDDTRGSYGRDDPRGSYGQDDARGGYGQDDARGGYGRDETRGAYGQDDARGGYGQDDARGGYGQDEMRGDYGRDDTRGHYDRDDSDGRYRQNQDEAPSLGEDFSDYDATGPLPAVPFSRYGTRS